MREVRTELCISDTVVLLLELLEIKISSMYSWILASSSDVNLHLFSAACSGCDGGGTELLFPFDDVGGDKHEGGMEPVVIPSGNFRVRTFRPGRGQPSTMING